MSAHLIVDCMWIALLAVWTVGALTAKRAVRRQSQESRRVQLLLAVSGYVLLFSPLLSVGILGWRVVPGTEVVDGVGLALTVAGFLIAIWARLTLGGNWSSSVTVKQDHTLTIRGPYAYVRHPIYSGLLLAVLGTAIVFGEVRCFLALIVMATGFWIKFHTEESFMEEEFGQQYSAYKERVKALIPGVL